MCKYRCSEYTRANPNVTSNRNFTWGLVNEFTRLAYLQSGDANQTRALDVEEHTEEDYGFENGKFKEKLSVNNHDSTAT